MPEKKKRCHHGETTLLASGFNGEKRRYIQWCNFCGSYRKVIEEADVSSLKPYTKWVIPGSGKYDTVLI